MFITKYSVPQFEIHGYDDKSDRYAVKIDGVPTWYPWVKLSRELDKRDFDDFRSKQHLIRAVY